MGICGKGHGLGLPLGMGAVYTMVFLALLSGAWLIMGCDGVVNVGPPSFVIGGDPRDDGGDDGSDDEGDGGDNGSDDEGDDGDDQPAFVEANFDDGDEGWQVVGGDFAGPTSVSWAPDVSSISATGSGLWYFLTPDDFVGDWSAAYGGTLRFDLNRDTSCSDDGPFEARIILNGADWTIGWGSDASSQLDFAGTVRVTLDESEEWYILEGADEALVGSRVTGEIMQELLSDLWQLKVFGQRGRCFGTTRLNDVSVRVVNE